LRYEERSIKALAEMATTRRQSNVLQHMVGYLRQHLDEASRRELHSLPEDYRHGVVPLIVPLTLIRHCVR